jgi:antitoxin VapB
MLTRIFKSGNSLAVRIPRDLAIAGESEEVTIERLGNALIIRPVHGRTLAGIGKTLELFSKDFMAGGREELPEQDRDWRSAGKAPRKR